MTKRTGYLFLYLGIACFYSATGSGRIGGPDSLSMFKVAINIADHGNVRAEPCEAGIKVAQCVRGADGHNYSSYGILPSLVAAPVYAAGKAVSRVSHVPASVIAGFLIMQATALIAAGIPLAVAWWIDLMGFSWSASCFGALAVAFATPSWFFATKGFFAEPYMALPLILSAILVLHGSGRGSYALAGLLIGIAGSARIVALPVMPLLLGALIWRRLRTPRIWADVACFLVPMGAVGLLMGVFNYARFGSPTETGYQSSWGVDHFSNPLGAGLWSFLFEPDNSLIYFAPLAVLAPLGIFWLWKRRPLDALICGGVFLFYFVFFAKFLDGHAPWTYGPRYLVPPISFLFVPLCTVWDRARQGALWRRGVLIGLMAASIAIHTVGTIVPLPLYYWHQSWTSVRTGNNEYPGLIRSMFTGLPQVIRETAQAQGGRGIADPMTEPSPGDPAAFADFESFVQSFPNPINVAGPDLWLVKAALILHAPWLCAGIALMLLGCGFWSLRKGLVSP